MPDFKKIEKVATSKEAKHALIDMACLLVFSDK